MLNYDLSLWLNTPQQNPTEAKRERMAKITGKLSLTASKGIKPFRRIFMPLDFDYRASFFRGGAGQTG